MNIALKTILSLSILLGVSCAQASQVPSLQQEGKEEELSALASMSLLNERSGSGARSVPVHRHNVPMHPGILTSSSITPRARTSRTPIYSQQWDEKECLPPMAIAQEARITPISSISQWQSQPLSISPVSNARITPILSHANSTSSTTSRSTTPMRFQVDSVSLTNRSEFSPSFSLNPETTPMHSQADSVSRPDFFSHISLTPRLGQFHAMPPRHEQALQAPHNSPIDQQDVVNDSIN